MLTKVIQIDSVIDDTFDAYANELVPFTDAIQSEMEEILANECKSDRIYYAKYEMKKLQVRTFMRDAQWLDAGYTPNYEEYMKNALVEQQRAHIPSIIECYMKKYGASKEETYIEFQKEITNAWKDINNTLIFRPTEVPMFVLERILNCARVMDTLYQEGDGYTNSRGNVKSMINLLLVESIDV
ncbi:sesquiterpene synthase 9-like [Solanum verrucosum]|uniref:sesquiterpene synthase 9-like n=1 Tax=Solanum verrucosum TaxID=315347 RepID=UPI0020D12BD3|nr:sesquiterpene synthase 9-like [Solanum verrucosum]